MSKAFPEETCRHLPFRRKSGSAGHLNCIPAVLSALSGAFSIDRCSSVVPVRPEEMHHCKIFAIPAGQMQSDENILLFSIPVPVNY